MRQMMYAKIEKGNPKIGERLGPASCSEDVAAPLKILPFPHMLPLPTLIVLD